MKQSPILLSLLSILMLAGCAPTETPPAKRPGQTAENASDARFTGVGTDTNATNAPDSGMTDTNAGANAVANPFPTATPVPVAAPRDLPYGTPVPGKPGYVISPLSPNAGYVDVRGFPPGSEVKDPYVKDPNKPSVFLVP